VFAKLNGITMAYQERRQAEHPVLLLVHGFPLDSRMWAAQLDGLAAEARLIAPDLRGHGRSDAPPGPYTVDGHADDLAALLDLLGIERAIVAGLSMGGYVAFAMWHRHAARVAGLALLDTRAEPDTPAGRANRDAGIALIRERGVLAVAGDMLPKVLAPSSQRDAGLTERVRAMMADQPASGMIGALAAMRDRPDSVPTLATITVPTLVAAGADDQLTPPADARAMGARIRGAEVAIIPQAGHLSPMENPAAVNGALVALIRRVRP